MEPKRVLVVDDEPAIVECVGLALRQAGFEPESALNGAECLGLVTANPPDIIVLDIALPDLDGWEVLSRLKRSGHAMPVLIASAAEHAGAKLCGFNLLPRQDYIVKPFETSELVGKVKSLLNSPGMEA